MLFLKTNQYYGLGSLSVNAILSSMTTKGTQLKMIYGVLLHECGNYTIHRYYAFSSFYFKYILHGNPDFTTS